LNHPARKPGSDGKNQFPAETAIENSRISRAFLARAGPVFTADIVACGGR
jgi:hypothetical protein